MRNTTFLFWVSLLVHGVFGDTDAVSVSVMEGDSVTLNTDVTEVQRDDKIIWKFGNVIIAKMNEADGIFSTFDGPDERFRDRLKLDKQTGSLTITNIRPEHVELYSVDIKSTDATLKTFKVTVHDIVESVSATEGDTVTLHTGVTEIQKDDQILWKFGDQVIRTDRLNGPVDASWKNIDLNDQTRDLTISNIRIDQSGDYKLEINTISMILHRKYYITVGVFSVDREKKMSVMEGDRVTLQTRITNILGDDVIEWTFGPTSLVKTDRENRILSYNEYDVRFTDRLHLDTKTGDLIISNTHTEISGIYQLKIIKSTYSLQKSFSVTVNDRSGAVSGISGASVVLMVWAITVFLLQEV